MLFYFIVNILSIYFVMYNAILIRYSEIFIKKGKRKFFIDILRQNLFLKLSGFKDISLLCPHGYFIVKKRTGDFDVKILFEIISEIKKVFGIVSLSPSVLVDKDIDKIIESAISLTNKLIEGDESYPIIKKFKIDASRSDKKYFLNSISINRKVGEKIIEKCGLKVDLKNPDLKIYIHITNKGAFIFDRMIKCYGGLPVGSSGKILLMLSGGIDSPVAGWFMMKRGLEIDAVYFHSHPYTKQGAKDKVLKLGMILKKYQKKMRIFVIPFAAVQKQFFENVNRKYLILLYRRAMMKIACILAEKFHYDGIATGENLGQVASQTIKNIGCIDAIADKSVFRPLICHDKMETVSIAREIGTFETSIIPYEDCCSLFVPKHPETEGKKEILEDFEKKLDLEALFKIAIEQMEIIEV